jgi:hypothetical protein
VLLLPTVAEPKDNEFGEMLADTVGPDPEPGWLDTPVLPHPVITGNANRTTMAQACATFIAIKFPGFVTVLSHLSQALNTGSQNATLPCSHGMRRGLLHQSKWAFETVRKTTADPVLPATALRGGETRVSRPIPEQTNQE